MATQDLNNFLFNTRGNMVERRHFPHRERYHYDLKACRASDGWQQWPTRQDAWYFGIWIHPERLVIVTFAEGDEELITCETLHAFNLELRAMATHYGPPPVAFTTIDDDGTITHYLEEARPGDDEEGGK